MIRGLYTAGLGMRTQMEKMDVVSNNLANVDTKGFKKDQAIVSSFSDVLMTRIQDSKNNVKVPKPIGRISLGVKVDGVYTDFTQGILVRTDEKFNVAIQGDGFIRVTTPAGEERYIRDGAFIVDEDGLLKTQEGNLVRGEAGVITLGAEFLTQISEVVIEDDGRILINGQQLDTLQMVSFEDNNSLQKVGSNLYQANAEAVPFEGRIVQGFLEGSNVNPVTAMVDLIAVSRTYEANQKMIQTHDNLMGKAVNEVGKA